MLPMKIALKSKIYHVNSRLETTYQRVVFTGVHDMGDIGMIFFLESPDI